MSWLSHLECGACAEQYDPERIWNLCPACGKPLLARYRIDRERAFAWRTELAGRSPGLWRYAEMLPVRNPSFRLTLGEGGTPLLPAERLGAAVGCADLWIKDEGVNPTGSFKARGLCVAVSRALELGAAVLSIPSAGNAAGAMSAYASLAGLPAFVFMPRDVPRPFVSECRALGAEVEMVDGVITDCGRAAAEGVRTHGRFDMSTLKEPYRIEGKKTMGYEIAERFGWVLPDVILYPTGGGTGLIGMWKAFDEMEQMGWIGGRRPRMVVVQSTGCAPMVTAFQAGADAAQPWPAPETIADGLRVPAAVGDFLILSVLRESRGTAIAVPDAAMLQGANLIGRTQGIFASPEGGATVAALQALLNSGWIDARERVVLFNTGSGHKYEHLWA
jgi:threonine synthase